MSKVLWHITMSLDGFIAGPGSDMGWMANFIGPNSTVDAILGQIGAVLMGAHTYQIGNPEEGGVYGGAWKGPQFVLTHAAADTAAPGFTFISGDIAQAVNLAKAAAGDRYLVVLGASTARQILEAGLLDEVLVHIVPVLLGDGVRLFSYPGGTRIQIEQTSLTQSESRQVTNLWLRIK